jgi:hypothetical protein
MVILYTDEKISTLISVFLFFYINFITLQLIISQIFLTKKTHGLDKIYVFYGICLKPYSSKLAYKKRNK